MRCLTLATGLVAAFFWAMDADIARATTIDASTDVWIRSQNPDTTYENDGISVWATGLDDAGGARSGAIEFDISGVTQQITGAYIKLYNSNPNHSAAFRQSAALLSPAGITTLTWTNVSSRTQTALESLGSYDIPASTVLEWIASANASAADISALESIRTGSSGKVTMLLTASAGDRDWNDVNHGYAPQLVLTTVPEPSLVVLLVTGLIGLVCYAWRKRS